MRSGRANGSAKPRKASIAGVAGDDAKSRETGRGPISPIEALALGMVVAAFAVMLVKLGAKALWVDESIAVLPARSILESGLPRSPFDLNYMQFQLQDGLWDPSAPLYRYVVAALTAVVGFSETTTRGVSVLFGLVMLWPCHAMFRRLYGRDVAALTVMLLAALPAFADHCREARHFTFVAAMMVAAFHFLTKAADGDDRARAIWPVFLVATLLGHSIGYVALPVVAAFFVEAPLGRLLARRYWPVYLGVIVVYAAIEWRYGRTLPFFHSIGCHNRVAGCERNPLYYFLTLSSYYGWIESLDAVVKAVSAAGVLMVLATSVPMALMAVGFVLTARSARREPERRAQHVLVLAWFVLPLLLLSMQELKFARYIFYVLPPGVLFIARGVEVIAAAPAWGRAGRWALAGIALFIVFGPTMSRATPVAPLEAGSRFVQHATNLITDPDADGWQGIRKQVAWLKERMIDGDVVVTSFDDASLGYHLGRFVHGFLNSEHDDAYFMKLLAETGRRRGTVYFMDTLPAQNHCHTPGPKPRNVDCRIKYARFYAACMEGSPTRDPACVRRPIR